MKLIFKSSKEHFKMSDESTLYISPQKNEQAEPSIKLEGVIGNIKKAVYEPI